MTDSTQPIILITGSRKWSDDAFIHDALAAQNPALVVAGAAAGADRIAAKWCHANGVGLIEVPALWDSEGKAAGPKRNARMLKVAQLLAEGASRPLVVLAFPTVESKGTFNMIALCQKKGIEPVIHATPSTIVQS